MAAQISGLTVNSTLTLTKRLRAFLAGTLTISALVACVAPEPLRAQKPRWLLPSREYLPKLIAGPRDPVTQAKLVLVTESVNQFEDVAEAEVALGASVPGFLLAGHSLEDALVFGIEAAVFGRFTLETIERDVISTDWVVLVPLVLHRGNHWFRLAYHHISSHLGDDYINRFRDEARDYGRDAVDGLAYIQVLPQLAVYGGANVASNVHPDDARRWTLRLGNEFRTTTTDGNFMPYGALDFQLEQDNGWEPRVDVQLGAWFPKLDGRRVVRCGIEFLAGPSPQGQFSSVNAAEISFGVWVEL